MAIEFGKPFMVKQTVEFSDGTQTVIDYKKSIDSDSIEKESDDMVKENNKKEEVKKPKKKVEKEQDFEIPSLG